MSDKFEKGEAKGVFVLGQQVNIDIEGFQLRPGFGLKNGRQILPYVGPTFQTDEVVADLEEFEFEIAVREMVICIDSSNAFGIKLLGFRPKRPFIVLEALMTFSKVLGKDDRFIYKGINPVANQVSLKYLGHNEFDAG